MDINKVWYVDSFNGSILKDFTTVIFRHKYDPSSYIEVDFKVIDVGWAKAIYKDQVNSNLDKKSLVSKKDIFDHYINRDK